MVKRPHAERVRQPRVRRGGCLPASALAQCEVKALFFKIEFLDSKEYCPKLPAKSLESKLFTNLDILF